MLDLPYDIRSWILLAKKQMIEAHSNLTYICLFYLLVNWNSQHVEYIKFPMLGKLIAEHSIIQTRSIMILFGANFPTYISLNTQLHHSNEISSKSTWYIIILSFNGSAAQEMAWKINGMCIDFTFFLLRCQQYGPILTRK